MHIYRALVLLSFEDLRGRVCHSVWGRPGCLAASKGTGWTGLGGGWGNLGVRPVLIFGLGDIPGAQGKSVVGEKAGSPGISSLHSFPSFSPSLQLLAQAPWTFAHQD